MYDTLKAEARKAMSELVDAASLKEGNLVVVGCSSSEVAGHNIGSYSSVDIAEALFDGLYPVLEKRGIFLAAQCCEHLNRALILEAEAVEKLGLDVVNVVPQPKAGGSFATTAYRRFRHPAAVEGGVRAQAGMDIGGTLIGMHLMPVAVPIRLSLSHIGEAIVLYARTRPKYIGGERAHYDETLA
jgi:uncharacterized protein (TIGR01440 family)